MTYVNRRNYITGHVGRTQTMVAVGWSIEDVIGRSLTTQEARMWRKRGLLRIG